MPNIDRTPLLIVIDMSPSFPDKTLKADISVVYCIFGFAHGSILISISYNLQGPAIVSANSILRNWFKSLLQRVFCFQLLHEFFFVDLNSFWNVGL